MNTHKPSNFVTALIAVGAGAVAIAGIATLYLAYGHHIGPDRGAFIGLACVLFGVAAASLVLRLRLATGRWVASTVLVLVGLLGFASAWALRIAPDAIAALDPRGLFDAALPVLSRRPPIELWLIVGAEVGILVAISVSLAGSFKARLCHWCSSTCSVERDVSRRADTKNLDEIRRRLERHNWDWFRDVGEPEPGARSWIRFDLGSCTCGLTRTLSATRVRKLGIDREIVRNLRQKPEDVRVVRGFGLPQEPMFEGGWGAEISSVG